MDNENSINGLYHGDTTKEKAITSVTGKLDILPAILERVPLSYDSGMLDGTGWDADQECYCYDGFPCPDASDMEEAEMEYWNTH